jgi:hypothetical protein
MHPRFGRALKRPATVGEPRMAQLAPCTLPVVAAILCMSNRDIKSLYFERLQHIDLLI